MRPFQGSVGACRADGNGQQNLKVKNNMSQSRIVVEGGISLAGKVGISGSKNAVLPLLAATVLTDAPCLVSSVPGLKDVEVMSEILRNLGSEVHFDAEAGEIRTLATDIATSEAPAHLVKSMRASVVCMGPMLARTGAASFPLPGGCAIGERPIDLHIKGFMALGADIEVKSDDSGDGFVEARCKKLKGAEVYLDFASVGATQNIMMAASLAEGFTIIENAAQEPEVVDLANFLRKMGARIKGAGTDVIKIKGVEKLHGAEHHVIPDRIEAGTYMLAAAISRGNVLIDNMVPDHVVPITAKLRETGVRISEENGGVRVKADEALLRMTDIKTLPYPGFPTDIQPQFMAFLSTVNGPSAVIETVFENRFMHVAELNKMNANIIDDGRRAIVKGNAKLKGAKVRATDLRAGAALVIAGLAAEGTTEVSDIYHIDRGYEDIVGKLRSLGASIERIDT